MTNVYDYIGVFDLKQSMFGGELFPYEIFFVKLWISLPHKTGTLRTQSKVKEETQ